MPGVLAVRVLEWRDGRDAVASLVDGPRLERVLVAWKCGTLYNDIKHSINVTQECYIYRKTFIENPGGIDLHVRCLRWLAELKFATSMNC